MIYANGEVIQDRFPDGTLHLNIEKCDFEMKSVPIYWDYKSDDELFTLICLKGYLDDNYPKLPDMPYLPHARMDRVKNKKDVFTLKYFCQVINSLNFDKVIIRDCHSNVGIALLDRVEHDSPKKYIERAIDRSRAEILFFPDEGAMKRYSSFSFGLPYAYGTKNRDWETGEIKGVTLVNEEIVKSRDILIVDDICSCGRTFVRSIEALKKMREQKRFLCILRTVKRQLKKVKSLIWLIRFIQLTR